MNAFAADRTADRCCAAFRFRTIDNVIASDIVHGDVDWVIDIDGDSLRYRRRVIARRIMHGDGHFERRMRFKHVSRDINLIAKFPGRPGIWITLPGYGWPLTVAITVSLMLTSPVSRPRTGVVGLPASAWLSTSSPATGSTVRWTCGFCGCCGVVVVPSGGRGCRCHGVQTIRSIGWNSDIT